MEDKFKELNLLNEEVMADYTKASWYSIQNFSSKKRKILFR